MSEPLRVLEEVLAEAFAGDDPLRILREARSTGRLDERFASALDQVDADGVELSGLLVAKLRFERLVQGSGFVREWFERDPQGFTDAFKRYRRAEPPLETFPGGEGRRFEEWFEDDRER